MQRLPDLPGSVAFEMICRALFVTLAAMVVLAFSAAKYDIEPIVALTIAALVSAYDFTRFIVKSRRETRSSSSDRSGRSRPIVTILVGGLLALWALVIVRSFEASAPSISTTWTTKRGVVEVVDRRLPTQSVDSYVRAHLTAIEAVESDPLWQIEAQR